MPTEVNVGDEVLEFPDEMSQDDIKSVLRKRYQTGPPALTEQEMGSLYQDFAKQQEMQSGIRALTGGSQFSPGGPEMDFARSLYLQAPKEIGKGLQTVMQPIEEFARPVFNQLRYATAPTTYAMTVEMPTELKPGESVIAGLEPRPSEVGIIPSIRRATAGMTTPGSLALLPIAATETIPAKLVQAGFATGAAASIPESVQKLAEAKTPAETRGALTDIGLSTLMAGLMGREAMRVGEAPYGKTSFMREAEAPTTERTQNALLKEGQEILPGLPESEVSQKGKQPVSTEERGAQTPETPVESGVPSWVAEEMQRRGISTGRIFNDIDLGNPSIRSAIELDPTLTREQKDNLLKTGSLPSETRLSPEQTAKDIDMTLSGVTPAQVPGQPALLDFRFKEPGNEMFSVVVPETYTLDEIQAAKAAKIEQLKQSGDWKGGETIEKKEGQEEVLTQPGAATTAPEAVAPPSAPPAIPPGPPTAPPPTPTPEPAPGGGPVTLEDVYKRFERIKKPSPSIKQMGVKIVEAVRTGMASKFRPIDKLAEDIASSYNVATPRGLSGIFEQLKGSTGRGEADIYRFDRDVSSLVKGSERDFNAYMFLRRTLDRLNQDLADIQRAQAGEDVPTLNRRQVSTYTIPEIEAKLRLLESNLGPEKVRQFQQAADLYQQYMDNALRLQVESGRMSPELYRAIKEGNQFYAPFKVMKYFEEISQPEGTGKKIDTVADYTKAMEGIEDPNFRLGDMLGAARQNILLSRILADKNNAMRKFAQLAVFDPEGLFIQRLRSAQDVPRGTEAVNVLENGKQVRYAVNPDVAQAIQVHGQLANSILMQVMGYAAIPMKAGATSLNIPFQVSNLLADVPRQALISKYGIKSAADLIRYPMDFARAIASSIAGDVFKTDNKIFLDFLDSGAAGGTVQEFLTPSALRFKPSSLEGKSATFAKSVLFALPDFAKAIEQTSKVMGIQRAMREHGVTSGKELAERFPEAITEIRRFSGSPDFGRQGRWVEQVRLNLIYMFFNARLQGAIADIGRLAGRDGSGLAAKTWFKLASAVGIPTVYLYLLNHDEEHRKDYLSRPEQERQNYWLIPKDTFITNEQGEKMRDYWRIPKRESAKWIANFTESALNFYQNQSPQQFGRWAQATLEDISPVNVQGNTLQERMESAASSLNPVMKAPLEIATGRDLYRHREIIPERMAKASPEQQYIERTPDVFKKLANAMPDVAPEVFRSPMMLENMVRNFTAGMITQFLPRKPMEGRQGVENAAILQRFQAVPYTESREFDERMQVLERESADEQVTRYRNAKAIMDDNKAKNGRQLVEATINKYGKDVKLIERVVDLWVAEQRGITPQERRILALPVEQRASFIADSLRRSTPEQKAQLIRDFAQKRILTKAVAARLNDYLQPAPGRQQ